jgi:nucleoside-diphosphate-sugar epimerase
MSTHTILGAGGAIANNLVKELVSHQLPTRLVSRNPPALSASGISTLAADLIDPGQTLQAIRGSSIVYLCVGLPYKYSVWRHQWPLIIRNTIEACRQTGAKLIFFDNVYMYGRVDGPMTEETPYDPVSRKGDLRARIATELMSEVRKGNITATIARSADFYGPGSDKTSVPHVIVFKRLAANQRAQWLVNAKVPHSLTYTPDAAKALYLLATDENSWNQVWHLPTTANPPTGEEFIRSAAKILQKDPRYTLFPKWMIRMAGIFDSTMRELYEMLYQQEYPYLFDSSKFEKAYSFRPTSYEEGIAATAGTYLTGKVS